ncbi:YgiT-type zinc finger protein [Candidatus Poribacteria bacterium]|nr:YgiT-type zinc finger protein [Candidatus Poribacteria bacterium]
MKNICVFCAGDVEQRMTRVIEEIGDDLIIVEGVPAGVCVRCGEKEFAPDTVRLLKRIRKERTGITAQRMVPVVAFEKVAA